VWCAVSRADEIILEETVHMMRLTRISWLSERINCRDEHPFSTAAIASLEAIDIPSRACFFVGEDGTRKSMLMEAIASH
jgi:predicted ATPase